jgi:predicted transcriptional regulator
MLANVLLDDEAILDENEKMALWVLLRYANTESQAYPSLPTIARKMRVSESTAFKTIKSLTDKKIITKKRRYKDNHANTSSLYTIQNFDKIFKPKSKKEDTFLVGVRTKKFKIKKPPQFPKTEAVINADIPALDYASIVSQNIDIENLKSVNVANVCYIDEIFNIMVETLSSIAQTIRVAKEDKRADAVKEIFLKLNDSHIEYVLECLNNNTTEIKNLKSYIITSLYNSYFTKETYWKARVNHDLYGVK